MEPPSQNPNHPTAGGSHDGDYLRTQKRHKQTRDRLSELPDLALVHILSHLYTEEAARTSILSKRFNSLWNSVDSLKFSDKYSGKDGVIFIGIVDTALGFHRRTCIDKFSLEFDYEFTHRSFIDRWLDFAAQKQVKSIHLNFYRKPGRRMPWLADLRYTLPKILYENVNLVELVTCRCDFSTKGNIKCSRLRLLSMTQTTLNEELISMILGGCSVLETLELRDCTGFDKLKINSSSLRMLRIIGEQPLSYWMLQGEDCVLEISGPYLVSLEVSGMLYRTKLRLTDVGSLVNAVMAFTIMPLETDFTDLQFAARVEEIVKEILESLCLVKQVTVGGSIMKGLSTREVYNLSSPWSERRSLTLCIPVIEWSHLGIASLLHSSPYMESLVIKLSYCSDTCVLEHANVPHKYSNHEKYYWKSWSTISMCRLLHLKTVKIVGFQVSCRSMKPLFEFLEFLLSNSKALEEIVIHASRYVTRAALDEAMKLLSIPTASPDVILRFEPPHLWVDPLCMYQQTVPLFFT